MSHIFRISTAEIRYANKGPKISEVIENNRLLLGFVSYFSVIFSIYVIILAIFLNHK